MGGKKIRKIIRIFEYGREISSFLPRLGQEPYLSIVISYYNHINVQSM